MGEPRPPAPDLAALFDKVIDLDDPERRAWLARHVSDAAVRAEVLALCESDSIPGGILDGSLDRLASGLIDGADERAHDLRGTCIGPWRIDDVLGEGGAAVVWLGRRCDGRFEQEVAVKCLKTALADADARRRFEHEARILASLEHPGMVRLLDAGITDRDVPYLVMERVAGESLSGWCARVAPNRTQRLKMFTAICDTVQFAHRHLVVHRDLKPGNILVDTHAHPRLLDFGIAGQLSDDAATDASISPALTPSYAAPEQRRGEPAGVGADIYALGIVLGELLTGTRPIPANGNVSGRAQRGKLDADLAAIIDQCLRDAARERYPSVTALAADIRRFLAHEPVLARRGSAVHRARLFLRRHRVGTLATAAIVLALAAALGWSLRQTYRTRLALAESEAMHSFLVDLFESNVPAAAASTMPNTSELLQRGADKARTAFADNPHLRVRMLTTVGDIYRQLQHRTTALELFREALVDASTLGLDASDDAVLDARTLSAITIADSGDPHRAEPILEAVLKARRRHVDDQTDLVTAIRYLARVRSRLGKHDSAIALDREALRLLKSDPTDQPEALAATLSDLGVAQYRARDYATAAATLRTALTATTKVLGPVHRGTNTVATNLANALMGAGRDLEAANVLADVVRKDAKIFREPNAFAALHLANWGAALLRADQLNDARHVLERARASYAALDDNNAWRGIYVTADLAMIDYLSGRYAQAERGQREVLARFEGVYGTDHYRTASAKQRLARTLIARGQLDAARKLARESLVTIEKLTSATNRALAPELATLADIDRRRGNLDAARAKLEHLFALDDVAAWRTHERLLGYRGELARVVCQSGDGERALAIFAEVLQQPALAAEHARLSRAQVLSMHGDCLAANGRHQAAITAWRDALRLRAGYLPDDHPDFQRLRAAIDT